MSLRSFLYREITHFIPIPDRDVFWKASHRSYSTETKKCIWVHAASAGELEILAPLLRRLPVSKFNWVLTSFSASGLKSIDKISAELKKLDAQVLYSGLSPREGDWKKALALYRPALVMTAKYEAWPELWMSLEELDSKLVIIQAQSRTSLKLVKKILKVLGAAEPRLGLNFQPGQEEALRVLFPKAKFKVSDDPRWTQVADRVALMSSSLKSKIEAMSSPKPWMVFGSVWESDFEVISSLISHHQGTWWVVPHLVDEEHVQKIESLLKPLTTRRWSQLADLGSDDVQVIVVDAMGMLLELYQFASQAYVGGGFEKGVHSTLEPGFFGIPVSCGPKNAEKFPEIAWLQNAGQLKVVESGEELVAWTQNSQASLKSRGVALVGGSVTEVLDWILTLL